MGEDGGCAVGILRDMLSSESVDGFVLMDLASCLPASALRDKRN